MVRLWLSSHRGYLSARWRSRNGATASAEVIGSVRANSGLAWANARITERLAGGLSAPPLARTLLPLRVGRAFAPDVTERRLLRGVRSP